MDINIFLLILIIEVSENAAGIIAGRLYNRFRQSFLGGHKRNNLKKDADWLTLISYYPGEPTESLSLNKYKKGEKRWKKKEK